MVYPFCFLMGLNRRKRGNGKLCVSELVMAKNQYISNLLCTFSISLSM